MSIAGILVAPSLGVGGAERWMLDLVRHTERSEITWQLCAITHPHCDDEMLQSMSTLVPVYYEGVLYSGGKARPGNLLELLARASRSADFLVIWELCAECESSYVNCIELPIINVFHRHAAWYTACHRPEHILATGAPQLARELEALSGRKVAYAPYGVDPARFVPRIARISMRRKWGVLDSETVIGYVGRIDREKNCIKLAEACQAVGYHCKLLVHSDTRSLDNRSQRILDEMQALLGDRLVLWGPSGDIGSTLNAIEIFMLPSFTEAMSLSLLEAWGSGVPVVATPVGAVPDLERQHGRLIVPIAPDASEMELKIAIETALSPVGQGNAVRARSMVRDRYLVSAFGRRWTRLLRQAVQGQAGSS